MKIKNILFILSIILFTSCERESIKCEGKIEQETVISILKDDIFKEKSAIKFALGIEEDYLHNFFDNNLKLSLIRTTAKNKELKSCECSAQLGLNLNQEIIDFAINNAKGNNLEFAKERIANMLSMKVDIEYNVQKTGDDTIVETTIPSSEIGKLLGASFLYENAYKKSNKIDNEDISEKDITYFKINVDNLRVRTAPELDSEKIENLATGSEVEFLEKSNNQTTVTIKNNEITEYWYKVKTPSGKIGWIHGCCFDK